MVGRDTRPEPSTSLVTYVNRRLRCSATRKIPLGSCSYGTVRHEQHVTSDHRRAACDTGRGMAAMPHASWGAHQDRVV